MSRVPLSRVPMSRVKLDAATGETGVSRHDDVLRIGVPLVLVALAGVGWWWSARMVATMDGSGAGMSGSGSMAGDVMSLGSFLVAWLLMMAAMMLPAISPVVRLYGLAADAGRVAPLPAFVAGYLVVWTALGVPGYFAWRALMDPIADGRVWVARVAGGVLIAAAVWQLTPMKAVCLRHCRSPMSLFMRAGSSARRPLGAARMGAHHGLYCLGCCWALMAVLVAVGTMNLAWMVALSVVILLEKNAPHGHRIATIVAALLAVAGSALILHPQTLTTLT